MSYNIGYAFRGADKGSLVYHYNIYKGKSFCELQGFLDYILPKISQIVITLRKVV